MQFIKLFITAAATFMLAVNAAPIAAAEAEARENPHQISPGQHSHPCKLC